jgi:hypothetical protein
MKIVLYILTILAATTAGAAGLNDKTFTVGVRKANCAEKSTVEVLPKQIVTSDEFYLTGERPFVVHENVSIGEVNKVYGSTEAELGFSENSAELEASYADCLQIKSEMARVETGCAIAAPTLEIHFEYDETQHKWSGKIMRIQKIEIKRVSGKC